MSSGVRPHPGSAPRATVSGDSRAGLGRDRNDDRWAAAGGNGLLLVAVADGMGSTAGGGMAATIALLAVLDVLALVVPGPGAAALADAVEGGQQRVRAALPPDVPEIIRPGTTLTAAIVSGDRLHLVHAGDSSCWLYRRGELRRLTEAHTFAAMLVAAGALDRESAAARRLDHVLTRYVGMPGALQPQLGTVRLRAGDRVLLASDGLTRAVPAPTLARLLAGPHPTAAGLVGAAVNEQAGDDVTAVLVTVVADYPAKAEVAESAESRAASAGETEVSPSSATGDPPSASLSVGGGRSGWGGDGR